MDCGAAILESNAFWIVCLVALVLGYIESEGAYKKAKEGLEDPRSPNEEQRAIEDKKARLIVLPLVIMMWATPLFMIFKC